MTEITASLPAIAAIVPMRHDSERVVGKNYRPFAGRPLYQHIITTLCACKCIDQVIIDTDSPAIRKDVADFFPDVLLLERPKHLRSGTTPMNDVLLNTVKQVPADFYLQTHSTNPLLSTKTVEAAIRTFFSHHPTYDSLFGVTRLQTRLWDPLARPINHNQAILLRTQDLPPVYEENSCLYLFDRETLEGGKNRIGKRPYMFEIDRLEALDIDEEVDFIIAEQVFLQRERMQTS